jgi:4'-phosphopantetheinyl transferase
VTKLLSGIRLQIFFTRSGSAVSDRLEQEYLAMMPPGIRASILSYKRWQDRQATLFGKLLLLSALQIKFHDAGMQKFQSLEATRDGKPFIPGGPEFNISHSEDMIVLAVTESGAVGIDVEKIRAVNIEDFSQYIPEVEDLHEKYDADHVKNLFFDCWTQKEAVLKGYGKGLLAPLKQVALRGSTALFNETTWFIKKLLIDDGYCCHIATDQRVEHVAVEDVNLMNGDFYAIPKGEDLRGSPPAPTAGY